MSRKQKQSVKEQPGGLSNKPMVVVDLYSGKWVETRIGHESFNLTKNDKGKGYYGYCPRSGKLNTIELGGRREDEFVDGVIVVYTEKIPKSSERKIVAFTDNARVYRDLQHDPSLERTITENGKKTDIGYGVRSDILYNLKDYPVELRIKSSEGRSNLFRMQRFYKGRHKELDEQILAYLEAFLNDETNWNSSLMSVVEDPNPDEEGTGCNYKTQPRFAAANGGEIVSKNVRVRDKAMRKASYRCEYDDRHQTFQTSNGLPYMEGHHLIPCTPTNTRIFFKKSGVNIDCEENIVCLCPTCHRRVHFGSKEEKETILRKLWESRVDVLKDIGLDITFDDLLNLYSRE